MKIETKETRLYEGGKVHDVNIIANGGPKNRRKAIFSCESKEESEAFLIGLQSLIETYTIEEVVLI